MDIQFRPSRAEDEPFLQSLDIDLAIENLPCLPLAQSEILANLQYRAKLASYMHQWPNLITFVIKSSNTDVGKIVLSHNECDLRIIDLVISKRQRNQGIGNSLLAKIEQYAEELSSNQISLSVAINNRAVILYERFGFVVVSKSETHISMQKLLKVSPKTTSE